jgi:hypothetical protein
MTSASEGSNSRKNNRSVSITFFILLACEFKDALWMTGYAALEPATWETKVHLGERLLPFPHTVQANVSLPQTPMSAMGTLPNTMNGF